MKLYGLKTCDTCRKAVKWLEAAGHDFQYIDVRGGTMTRGDIERIVASAGIEVALNRKSTTWRGLPEAEREMAGPDDAVDLIMRHPALLKRPVIDFDGAIIVGFGPAQQAELAAKLA